ELGKQDLKDPVGSFVIQQEDVSISYLPLAHMFERMIQVVCPLHRCFSLTVSLSAASKIPFCHSSQCTATEPEWDSSRGTFLFLWMTLKPSNRPSFLLCLVFLIASTIRSVKHSVLLILPSADKAAENVFLMSYIFLEDPGFCDLSVSAGPASLRCQEKAGRALQRDCAEQQSVG
ncbi:hypothetical protein XENOCAPTIV_017544, partial [Xenoophorus captivus]